MCWHEKHRRAHLLFIFGAAAYVVIERKPTHQYMRIYNTPPLLVRLPIPYRASYVHISSASCRPLKTHNPTNIILLALRLRMHALKSILILFFHQPLMRWYGAGWLKLYIRHSCIHLGREYFCQFSLALQTWTWLLKCMVLGCFACCATHRNPPLSWGGCIRFDTIYPRCGLVRQFRGRLSGERSPLVLLIRLKEPFF